MKKNVIVRGPILSMSGYGEQARFAIRCLKQYEDLFNIFVIPTTWGATGWIHDDTEERSWLDKRIYETVGYVQNGGKFDISLQVTIPNEWDRMAPINIGYTAGIESHRVAPIWLEKANLMDKIIVVSKHAKQGFENTMYKAQHKETGQEVELKCTTPIEVVNYSTMDIPLEDIDLDLPFDFNFLVVAQHGPRKNILNTIRWFVEENFDQEVGLVLKTFTRNGSTIDREHTTKMIEELLLEFKDRKCKVHLLHGDMTPGEIRSLYVHPKIKVLVSLTHGEGFGLPLFEAAQAGLPIIAPGWSGQTDFLYIPETRGKKKGKKKTINRAYFEEVDFDIAPIPQEAVWDGVLQADSMWCYPRQGSYKMALRKMRKNHDKSLKRAEKLKVWIQENFTPEQQHKKFVEFMGVKTSYDHADYIFVSDFFADQLPGGAEMSLEALMKKCPADHYIKVNSVNVSEKLLEVYKNSKWVFGNIANISDDLLAVITTCGIEYTFVEFDYKFCEYRNPLLYEHLEDEKCEYSGTLRGQLITEFVNNSKNTFFMSEEQKNVYAESLAGLDEDKLAVLSSIFDDGFFETIEALRQNQNGSSRNKWLVLGSRSWVKGSAESEKWCKDHNLDYEVVSGLGHEDLLKKMSSAKGVCFKPTGLDTCPRFVIEAKLLGCELKLNENVQHSNEGWFATDDVSETITYLKGRPNEFWSRVAA